MGPLVRWVLTMLVFALAVGRAMDRMLAEKRGERVGYSPTAPGSPITSPLVPLREGTRGGGRLEGRTLARGGER
jgi:hypothetical protein